jgi:hypothetical protein
LQIQNLLLQSELKLHQPHFLESSVQLMTNLHATEKNLKDVGYEGGRLTEFAHDHVQWQALVLAVLNLLPES